MADGADDEDLFDRPARWRFEAVRRLGLRGVDAIAGLNTGAGYPDALEPAVGAFRGQVGRLVDVGAGLGATTAWLATQTGVGPAFALEPEVHAVAMIPRSFPDLHAVAADARSLPLRHTGRAGLSLLGVVSLVDELPAVLAEAVRVAGPGGRIAVVDLCATGSTFDDGPNVFRTPEDLAASLLALDAAILEVRTAAATRRTAWSAVAERVDQEIEARHGGTAAFAAWRDDRARLGALIDAGDLVVGTVTAAVPARARAAGTRSPT